MAYQPAPQGRELQQQDKFLKYTMIALVAVLALASAGRMYLVTTLGERVVADLRRETFSHLVSLSPGYFDAAKTGELTSRLTADTTQIKAAARRASTPWRKGRRFMGSGSRAGAAATGGRRRA